MALFKKKAKEKKETPKKEGMFSHLKAGLNKTRHRLTGGLGNVFLGEKVIEQDVLDDIEGHLLSADIGFNVTHAFIERIKSALSRRQLENKESLITTLKQQMIEMLESVEEPLAIDTQKKPYVILVIGVNGTGKTTTIGKLAQRFQNEGLSVILAAGDTFRAAAIEQLQVWGNRHDIPVVAQSSNSDSASVIFDAMVSAKAKNIDILIADTAGRLHTQNNLMEELKKVVRVIKKQDDTAPHEVLLVLDAGIGQNNIVQAKEFHEAVGVSGLCLTKLDGTAKGGAIFAIAKTLQIPIRFIGVGEQASDLQAFNANQFVKALLGEDK